MDDIQDFQSVVPFPVIFPEAEKGVYTLFLAEKVGKAKAGDYHFVETYCVDPVCDCRRTTIFVVNTKGKPMAVIDFGFDPDGPQAGPFLSDFEKQSPAAGDLLKIFVEVINENPEWLKNMYQHYRLVRRKITGKPYRGGAFPKPGKVRRQVLPPLDPFPELLPAAVHSPPRPRTGKAAKAKPAGSIAAALAAPDMATLVECYRQVSGDRTIARHRELQDDLGRYLAEHAQAGEELATLLVRLAAAPKKNRQALEAALRLLFDALEILRYQLEIQRPGAREHMARWQEALARHVFAAGGEADLCTAVTGTLLQARVEILPQLHEAGSRRMLSRGEAEMLNTGLPEDDGVQGLFSALEASGVDSPFELMEGLLEMIAVGDAEVQMGMAGAMLTADSQLIRETGALMLFHPQAAVRAGLAQGLSAIDGKFISPATLRRLIVARNWFPEEIRTGIDQAVSNARRARVECAPIPQGMVMSVYASAVDGAGAQSFQAVIPDGNGFVSCSILLKMGVGVADAFMVPLKNKRALGDFQAMLAEEAAMLESTPAHLDQRVCQALAEGARLGKVPSPWLVAIAECLGREHWRVVPFDPRQELATLRAALEISGSKYLTERAGREALELSAKWHERRPFAASWFEDGAAVERDMLAATGKKKNPAPDQVQAQLLGGVLQERRENWLERLVLTAMWLRSAKHPPLPWPQMFHVAAALADDQLPLREIPLMCAVAAMTCEAYQARKAEGGW
ncbi:MAG: hypothetical protein HGA96_06375 [Desulfobulbaceae bacterium]|nr:hypothetical protein [Desulfobulbaceae bacterium]